MSFSDWGNRQQANWKSGLPSESFPTANGFTGHHELDKHKLVHMGGRVYDPNLGRFLSADLLVQSPYSSQSFNRYTYVANNPLSRIDPTGYEDVDTVTDIGSIDYPDTSHTDVSAGSGISFNYGAVAVDSAISPILSTSSVGESEAEVETIIVTGYKKSSQDNNGVGLGGRYSPNKSGWHDYTLRNVVCPAKDRCTAPEMKDQLLRFAAPGQDSSKPIVHNQISMVIDPRPIISMAGYTLRLKAGLVVTKVGADGFSITNITLPGHLLYDGQIKRTLSLSGNGDWVVTTHGIGNNNVWWQLGLGAAMNEWQGPKIFNYVDNQMIENIQAHH